MAPWTEGAGLLYIRRDWIERLRPLGVGWHSVTSSYNSSANEFTLKPNAQRWEGGTFPMPGLQAFGASLTLFHEIGLKAVSDRILILRLRDSRDRAIGGMDRFWLAEAGGSLGNRRVGECGYKSQRVCASLPRARASHWRVAEAKYG